MSAPRVPLQGESPGLRATVAVTGASGVIGRRLVPALSAAGATVRVLTHREMPSTSTSVSVIPGDILDKGSLESLLQGADAIIHLAGRAHTSLRTPQEEAEAASINVGGARTLLQAAAAAGTPHFVFFSSAHVYAGQQGLDLQEDALKEAGTGYAAMKLQAESFLHEHAPGQMAVTILRPCLTYGPGVRFNLRQLLRAVQTGRYVHPGGADAMRSLASVDTISAAVVHLLSRGPVSETYNLADRSSVSLREWVDALAAELRVRPPRSVPVQALRLLAAAGSVAHRAGVPAPLTTDALRKLTVPFTLNLDRLAATGFVWPSTTGAVVAEMVAQFQAENRQS